MSAENGAIAKQKVERKVDFIEDRRHWRSREGLAAAETTSRPVFMIPRTCLGDDGHGHGALGKAMSECS